MTTRSVVDSNASPDKANTDLSTAFSNPNIITSEEAQLFIGSKFVSYYRKWKNYDEYNDENQEFIIGDTSYRSIKERLTSGWNWAAFFFGPFWFAYRKVYYIPFVYLFFIIVSDSLYQITRTDSSSYNQVFVFLYHYNILYLILFISFGMYGNKQYFLSMEKKIKKIKEINLDLHSQHIQITMAGGGSWLSLVIAIIIFCVYVFLIPVY